MTQLRSLMKWMTQHKVVSFSIVVVLIAALSAIRLAKNKSKGILTEPLQRGTIVESVYGIGTVMANRIYRIAPGVSSTVTEVFVKEGDLVKRGAPLISTDNIINKAPFEGTITSLNAKVGVNIFPGVPILTLIDLTNRYLLVSLEQQGALRVQRGQKVKISFDTIRQQNYDGTVETVYSNENNFLARIDIGALPNRILPGMTADVAIEIATHNEVLLIPVAALENGNSVLVKKEYHLPQKVAVKIGIIDKAFAEMVEGPLNSGDRLLISEKK